MAFVRVRRELPSLHLRFAGVAVDRHFVGVGVGAGAEVEPNAPRLLSRPAALIFPRLVVLRGVAVVKSCIADEMEGRERGREGGWEGFGKFISPVPCLKVPRPTLSRSRSAPFRRRLAAMLGERARELDDSRFHPFAVLAAPVMFVLHPLIFALRRPHE